MDLEVLNSLNKLQLISQTVGVNIFYVQGGGGNTSVKLNEKEMAIKASGWSLLNVTNISGYCIVNYNSINNYLENPDLDEPGFVKKINSFVKDKSNNLRPSIETGFHAMLGKYVIHTHSVFVNSLTCAKEGKDILLSLFPKAIWIDYVTPGVDVTLSIKKAIKNININETQIIFLENHGVIVSANSEDLALKCHDEVNEKIKSKLNINYNIDLKDFDVYGLDLDFICKNILFPDQVVYLLLDPSENISQSYKEILWTYDFVLETIKFNNLTPKFLAKESIDIILNMESEKYRRQLAAV